MFDRIEHPNNMRNGDNDADLQIKLDHALLRALKAEKAFLTLKLQNYQEKMNTEIKMAEQECITKLNLYSSIPEQAVKIQEDFKSKTLLYHQLITRATEVHQMCLVGLEEGLTMEELPSLNPDQTPADFGNLVRVRLKEKQDNERARAPNGEMIGSPLRMQNGLSNGSRNGSSNNLLQNPSQSSTPPNPLPLANSQPMPAVSVQSTQHGAVGQSVPTQQRQPRQQQNLQQQQQVPNNRTQQSLTQNQVFGLQSGQFGPQSSIRAQSSQQQRPLNSGSGAAVNVNSNGSSNESNRQQQVVMNDLSGKVGTMSAPPSASQSASQSSGISSGGQSNYSADTKHGSSVTHSAAGQGSMGIGDLDDFVIDDEMFQSHNQNSDSPTDNKGTANSPNIDQVEDSDKFSSDDDDEEFARNLAQRQGNKARKSAKQKSVNGTRQKQDSVQASSNTAKSAGVKASQVATSKPATAPLKQVPPPVKQAPPAAPKTEVSTAERPVESKPNIQEEKKPSEEVIKKGVDPADEINWKEEPFITIVSNLADTYRVNRKIAQEALESAARKLGGVEQLDAVWAEAERIVKQPIRPLQPRAQTSSQPAATAAAAVQKTTTLIAPQNPPVTKPSAAAVAAAAPKHNPYKTSLCAEYTKTKKCKHGEYCLYAHGERELKNITDGAQGGAQPSNFYKVIMCRNWVGGEPCRWGDNCIFAHGEKELRKSNLSVTAASEQAQPQMFLNKSVHPEPCDTQQCPAKLEFLLKKTGICEMHIRGQCKYGKDCKFAHSRKELKPMPKWELCQRAMRFKCQHMQNPERCVYAHSQKELRKKPVEYEAANRSTVNTGSGGRLIQPGRRYIPWAGDARHPPTPEDADECHICMGPLLEKKNLMRCGHNNFHERCISQWVNEGVPSCPICREPAQLPDLFKAPAGFKPEEFPGLGL